MVPWIARWGESFLKTNFPKGYSIDIFQVSFMCRYNILNLASLIITSNERVSYEWFESKNDSRNFTVGWKLVTVFIDRSALKIMLKIGLIFKNRHKMQKMYRIGYEIIFKKWDIIHLNEIWLNGQWQNYEIKFDLLKTFCRTPKRDPTRTSWSSLQLFDHC